MRSMTRNLPAYLQIINLWMQTAYAYRLQLLTELLALMLKIFLFRVVWTAVYAGRTEVDGIALNAVISFMTLANLQLYLMSSMISGYLHDRIREGLIALDLARPVPFLGQLIANQIGGTCAFGPLIILAAPIAFLIGGIQAPASLAAGFFYLISLLLAYLITSLIDALVGMIAFWTTEIWGIRTIVQFVSQFFSGTLVPFWFFPPILREIAAWMPFQAQAFIPLEIFLGHMQGQAIISALGLQLFWIIMLSIIVVLVWRRAMGKVVVQGG